MICSSETINSTQSPSFFETLGLSQQGQKVTRSSLVVAATGLGKTVIMGGLARSWPSGRVMMISHRYELNQQAMSQLSSICGEDVDLEQADYFADRRTNPMRIVVASVQTLNSYQRKFRRHRFERFAPEDFGLLMIDEAHRSAAASYRKVVDHFRQNPDLCVVGVTATPDRLDGVGMGCVFETVACDLNLLWGVENGWLVAPKQVFVQVDGLDLSHVRTVGGDLDERQLAKMVEVEENLHAMAKPIVDVCGADKQAIVFTASVAQAHRLSEMLRDYHARAHGESTTYTAVAIDGSLSPQDPKRKAIVKDFKEGRIQYLCNCGVACLDEQTELLTANGWVGLDDISLEHEVASWDPVNGAIEFSAPLAVEVRARRRDEGMVFLETGRRSVRVTDDHRMAYMTGEGKSYKVATAKELVGRVVRIPVSGTADPSPVAIDLDRVSEKTLKARVRSAAYVYRKQGMGATESRELAEKGCRDRAEMSRKSPSELKMSELHLIGMWVGDGTATRLKSGGVEYSIAQSLAYPGACDWIRKVISRSSIDHVERTSRPGSMAGPNGARMVRFSMPRGTGFGAQKRKGVYHLEQYLSKTEFRWLMGLSEEQLVWFVEGLWMADGEHGHCSDPQQRIGARAKSWRISSANSELNDWLQAACACRNMSLSITGGSMREGSTRPLWKLNVSRRSQHIATNRRFELEDGWKQERVWCVKSTTGFIVTRRKGSVTITGNTEGFDAPNVRVVAIGRPTKSRALYLQMLGRGTRSLPGTVDGLETPQERIDAIKASDKPYSTVIDFVGQSGRHKLVCATDFMVGEAEPKEIVERANKISSRNDFDGSTIDALREAREQIATEQEARRRKVTVGVDYKLVEQNTKYDLSTIPLRVPGYMQRWEMSEKQRGLLVKLGYTTAQVDQIGSKAAASKAIDYAITNPKTWLGRCMNQNKQEEAKKQSANG